MMINFSPFLQFWYGIYVFLPCSWFILFLLLWEHFLVLSYCVFFLVSVFSTDVLSLNKFPVSFQCREFNLLQACNSICWRMKFTPLGAKQLSVSSDSYQIKKKIWQTISSFNSSHWAFFKASNYLENKISSWAFVIKYSVI